MGMSGETTLDHGTNGIDGAGDARARHFDRAGLYRFTGVVLVVVVLLFLLLVRVLAATQAAGATTGGQVGQRAPDFMLAVWNLTPTTLHLHQLHGEAVVLNFWASWCEPCQQEAPLLTAAAHASAFAGVAIVGVAEQTDQSDGSQYLQRQGIPYPCGPDPNGRIATAYAIPGLPVTLFINRQGIVAQRVTGQLTQASLASGIRAISS